MDNIELNYKTKIFKESNINQLENQLNIFLKKVKEVVSFNVITEEKFNITNFIGILIYK